MLSRTKSAKRNPRTESSSAPALSTGYWSLGLSIALAVVSYYPVLHYGFVFDDVQQIIENPAIRSWSNVPQYFTAQVGAGVFPGVKGSFYRPLFLIWLRLNYILFQVSPWGWHLTSLLAHLGAIWMFFALVRQRTGDGTVAGGPRSCLPSIPSTSKPLPGYRRCPKFFFPRGNGSDLRLCSLPSGP